MLSEYQIFFIQIQSKINMVIDQPYEIIKKGKNQMVLINLSSNQILGLLT